MPSSGSLSVPLVSSAYINWRRRDRLVRSRGMGKTCIIRCRQQVFVSEFHFIADCDWPYVYHQKMGISTKRLNLILMCWCGSATMCLCLTSHGDSLVLHSLPPSLVIKDRLDFVDILCSRSTGACQPHNFRAIAESWLHGIMIYSH